MQIKFSSIRPSFVDRVLKFSTDSREWESRNREHILAYEISGHSFHYFPDKVFEVKNDTVMFFNKKDRYTVKEHTGDGCYAIHFFTSDECECDSFIMDASDNKRILAAFEKLHNICTLCVDCNSFAAMSQLYNILDIIEKTYNSKYSKTDKKLDEIITFLNGSYKENVSVEELSQSYGVSTRRFNDIFKSKTGLTPTAYVIDLRIKEAKELLKLGYVSINEVSYKTGFSDITYFSRVFKSKTGVTPTQFRNNML